MLPYILVTLLLFDLKSQVFGQNFDDQIVLPQGLLDGQTKIVNGRNVYYYLGIPYAEPPLGGLRFRPPVSHTGWTGSYSARTFKSPCPQPTGSASVRERMSEDCLYLNIWTPEIANTDGISFRSRPVILVIEGQLFTLSNPEDVPAEDLVEDQDVVVVTFSYRVNAFGFLSWEDPLMPGNLGLLDQHLAIKWVYDNIDQFGGDPNKITLLGHSAGAASVGYHLIATSSRFFINSAIMMSGSVLAPWATQQKPRDNARILARSLGCVSDDPRTVMECLQDKRMIDIVIEVDEMIRTGNVSATFAPVQDEEYLSGSTRFLGESPKSALERGNFKKVPMVTGMMTEEGVLMGYFLKEELRLITVKEGLEYMRTFVIPAILRQKPEMSGIKALERLVHHEYLTPTLTSLHRSRLYDEIINLFNDVYFADPLEEQMRLMSDAGATIYFYVNDYPSRDIFGNDFLNRTAASHGSDLLYLFGPEMYRKFFSQDFQTFREERLSRDLKSIIGDLADEGAPVSFGQWRRYRTDERTYYSIEDSISGLDYNGLRASRFWSNLLPAMAAEIKAQVQDPEDPVDPEDPESRCGIYQASTWTLLLALIMVLILFLVVVYLYLKRRSPKLPPSPIAQSVFSVGSLRQPPMAAPLRPKMPAQSISERSMNNGSNFVPTTAFANGTGRRWRESVTDYRI